MSTMNENAELLRFYTALLQDLKTEQVTLEEGGTLEQLFTQWATDLLADSGETENVRIAYDEKAIGTKNQHKLNAYSISDNYETIDLFITIFKGLNEPARIGKDEVETASKRLANFFRKGVYKDYVNELDESSEIFDFAHTLNCSEELKNNLVRVNAIILTDGSYNGSITSTHTVSNYPIYYRVIDLDYLYNITEKSHVPIEIDFKSEGFLLPCIPSPSENAEYQSYLAIIPGLALATIYERFGSRLLEQNVRSFLQFTGKINKGIRQTIKAESHMFLAFNNGLATTAEEVEIEDTGQGFIISRVKDFQIVNGGQTTASIYHTWKKDKADISQIFVQLKLSVVKNRKRFSEIVTRISEYANTQNKVSVADLSSNRPYHVHLEKLSRNYWAPPVLGQSMQTRWFYERARGQYKNARLREGFTKAKQKAFDIKNPKNQVFTKEDIAKYLNTYREVYEGKKLVIGPHMVVRGNQKNYVQFVNHNMIENPDFSYFEDCIAKAILFRTAEKCYGIKPNSIGDMRYITVPYTISYLGYITDYRLDFYKIWRNQAISQSLQNFLYDLMKKVEAFIKSNAPGALYGEWAKKEECWQTLKNHKLISDIKIIEDDLEDNSKPVQRKKVTDEELEQRAIQDELNSIHDIPAEVWQKIEIWGKNAGLLNPQQCNVAYSIASRLKTKSKILDYERRTGIKILNLVITQVPEILFEIDALIEENDQNGHIETDITPELLSKVILWDKRNKRLKDFEYRFMLDLSEGKSPLTERNKKIALKNLQKIQKYGFT